MSALSESPADRRSGIEARAERESPIALGLCLCDTLMSFFGPSATREHMIATLAVRGCLISEATRIVDMWERLTGAEVQNEIHTARGLAGKTHGR